MAEAGDPEGEDSFWVWPFGLRLLLIAASLGTAWATTAGMHRWLLVAKANLDYSLVGWLPWMAGSVLAGLLFGVATWLPRRVAFRATTAIALGVIPFLGLINIPAYFHFAWWTAPSFTTDSLVFFGSVFGIAVASGFGDGARPTR